MPLSAKAVRAGFSESRLQACIIAPEWFGLPGGPLSPIRQIGEKILQEDKYRPVGGDELAHVGDIVVYIRKGHTEVLHVAIVFRIDKLDERDPHSGVCIRALSKWDNQSGEDSHALDDVVLNGGEEYVREIWTDRPSM